MILVEWHETHKLDGIRRAHAQRGVGQNSGGGRHKTTEKQTQDHSM